MSFSIVEIQSSCQFFERFRSLENQASVLFVNSARGLIADFTNRLRRVSGCVADFDGTLIPNIHWKILREAMSPEDQAAEEVQTGRYFSSPDASEEQIRGFVLEGAGRLVRARLSLAALAAGVQRAPPRSGVVELLHSFGSIGRVAVISLGVKQFIERWCINSGLVGVEVFALDLKWQSDVCVGCWLESVVTDHNKGRWLRCFCDKNQLRPTDLLVLGDGWTDRELFSCGGLNVFVLPKTEPFTMLADSRLRAVRELWSDHLDAVLVSDSLEPLAAIRCSTR